MKGKREATGVIRVRDSAGIEHEWRVACLLPDDNEETMRKHTAWHRPDCEFLGVKFVEYDHSESEPPR